ncbi:MAG: FkbM family methyltransferase [Bythopirellula sp.]|nr:FkbM family methyltransferase [Bythopirellula sp.]
MQSSITTSAHPRGLPPARLKDQYWLKKLKWHLYKKHFGSPDWVTRYVFDGLVRNLTANDVVIDCGANLGVFTRHLAAGGAEVHAFEPDPYTFSRLQENTREFANVHCYNQAVGVGAGRVKLFRTPNFAANPDAASISSSLCAEKLNVDTSNFVEVEQIDFVEFLRSLRKPVRLLKMDIEGAEVSLLEHMLSTGAVNLCEQVFVETHEDRIPNLAERTKHIRFHAAEKFPHKLHLDWH